MSFSVRTLSMCCTTILALVCFCTGSSLQSYEHDVLMASKATVSLDYGQVIEGLEIRGKIEILHPRREIVDPSSFRLGDQPIHVELIDERCPEEEHFSSMSDTALVLSIFRFTLPARKEGIYVLPAITLRVGQSPIEAPAQTFHVLKPISSDNLMLSARIATEGHIFPNQEFIVEYKIHFRGHMQITKEDLPLLNSSALQNIGVPEMVTDSEVSSTVQTIRQRVRARQAGVVRTAHSEVIGFLKVEGQEEPLFVHALAPPLDILIENYPDGRPASFTGALGILHIESRLLSKDLAQTTSFLSLELIVSGTGYTDTITLPNFQEQELGKSFDIESTSNQETITDGGTKHFVFQLRPKYAVQQIPPIEYASLDPISARYVLSQSDPIHIHMEDPGTPIESNSSQEIASYTTHQGRLKPITILGVIAGCCVVACLGILIHYGMTSNVPAKPDSHTFFLQAAQAKGDPQKCCQLMKRALLHALLERNLVSTASLEPHQIGKEGLEGDVRSFLMGIERKRFLGLRVAEEVQQLFEEAGQLYWAIRALPKGTRMQ